MNNNIKEWYVNAYPTDELGCEINADVTFGELYNHVSIVYDVLGVNDSLVRERVFGKLSEIMNVDYAVIYKKWLYESEVE
jgi:hypothetical protein